MDSSCHPPEYQEPIFPAPSTAHAGAADYVTKIRRSFQSFLDDAEDTSMTDVAENAVGHMVISAAEVRSAIGAFGTTIVTTHSTGTTGNTAENCTSEDDLNFCTPPRLQCLPGEPLEGPKA
jgi:hypothetical protein